MTTPAESSRPSGVARWIPGLAVARRYQRDWLGRDLAAGLILTTLLVPQGMAYAELAGLPPVTGLYTTVVALLAYAVFGPSRVLVLGPDSSLGPLIAASILPLIGANGDPARAIALASMLALIMGAFCIVAGLASLGTVAELLSKPVRVGYLNGIAVIVVVSQLPKFFGFSVEADGLFAELKAFAAGVRDGQTVPASLLIGVLSLVVILTFRRWLPRVPGVLVAVVGAIAATTAFDLAAAGVKVVGVVPGGFPTPALPVVEWSDVRPLVLAAAGLAFVTLADTIALSRSVAVKRNDDVDPNQEIAALGTANIAAGLFQGFPVSASASRTAVAESTGSRTQLTGVVGAVAIIVILVFANGLVQNLPSSTLAAIVIAAAMSLLDLETVRWLWRVRKSEFFLSMAALVGVAAVGVLEGIVVAIVLSLGNFIRRAWRPYGAVLGAVDGRSGYHDLERHPDAALIPGLLIYRFDAPVFFANAEHFARQITQAVQEAAEPVRWVVIAAEPVTDIDTTGAEVLADLLGDLRDVGIDLVFAELKGPVKDRLVRYELLDEIGADHLFPTIEDAIDAYRATVGEGPGPAVDDR